MSGGDPYPTDESIKPIVNYAKRCGYDELAKRLSENESYQEQYDAKKPGEIDPFDYGKYGDPEQVWLDLNNWEAIRTEIQDLRRARHDESVGEGVV